MKTEREIQGKSILKQRGIEKAARLAGWINEKRGWTYPVYDPAGHIIARRGKAYNSNAQPKYWWAGGKPINCHYYILPGLQAAVEAANGLVYIVSGEPDLLVMHSAGIHNVICWFGETSVPRNLPEFLQDELHAVQVIQYPDRDSTGYKSVQKVADLLSGSGIDYQARELPEYLGNKGDLNKLWQYHGFQINAYLHSLQYETTLLNIQPQESKSRRSARNRKSNPQKFENEEGSADYYAAVADKLGVESYQKSGWSNPVRCPMRTHAHDDSNPSAYWHPEMRILRCFKCGETYLTKDVAAVLGIDLRDFIKLEALPAPPDNQQKIDYRKVEDLRYFPEGIPDTIRSALLSLHLKGPFYDHGSAAVVLDLRQEAISDGEFEDDDVFTVSGLAETAARSGRNTQTKTIRTGIRQLIALGFFALSHTAADGRGRPTEYFKALRISSAMKRLEMVMNYRLREQLFGDDVPDIIEAEWFDEMPPEVANDIAKYENSQRSKDRLYDLEMHRDARKRYVKGVQANRSQFNLSAVLASPHTPLLRGRQCLNGRDYRVLFLESIIREQGSEGRVVTRMKAAMQLGVSNKTLSLVRLRARVIAIPRYKRAPIDVEAGNILQQMDRAVPWAAGRRYGRFLEASDGSRLPLRPQMSEKIIQKWIRIKKMLGLAIEGGMVQAASMERFATPEEYSEMLEDYAVRMEKRLIRADEKNRRDREIKARIASQFTTGQFPVEVEAGSLPPEIPTPAAYETSGMVTRKNPKVLYETVPESVTRKYIQDQLQLTPERESLPEHLIPYLRPYLDIEGDTSGKKGNKSPPEAPD